MEQLHDRARLTHKYIHVTISRIQTHFPDLSTHTIHSYALDMRNHSKQYGLFRLVTKYISESLCFSQKKNVILQ